MKTKLRIKNFIPFITMMVLIFTSLYFARIIGRAYEPIAEGILGVVFLILVYRVYYLSPELNTKEPTRFLFEYPIGFKYLGFGVFWAVVNYWALMQIFDMFRYLAQFVAR